MQNAFPETADIVTASDDYASRFAGPVGKWFLNVQARITLKMLGPDKNLSILDVGGGHGQLAIPLSTKGFKVTVLGSDESCSNRITPFVKADQCQFQVGNVIALPYPDKAFDVAISFRLLPHCEQWPRLVSELCRVAKSAVIVDYPVIQGLNALAPLFFSTKKKLEGNTREWRQFTHKEIKAELLKNRYAVAKRAGQFFLPMAVTRILLLKLGIIQDIGVISIIVTMAGILGSLVIWWWARRTGLNFLFERPQRYWIAPPRPRETMQAAE